MAISLIYGKTRLDLGNINNLTLLEHSLVEPAVYYEICMKTSYKGAMLVREYEKGTTDPNAYISETPWYIQLTNSEKDNEAFKKKFTNQTIWLKYDINHVPRPSLKSFDNKIKELNYVPPSPSTSTFTEVKKVLNSINPKPKGNCIYSEVNVPNGTYTVNAGAQHAYKTISINITMSVVLNSTASPNFCSLYVGNWDTLLATHAWGASCIVVAGLGSATGTNYGTGSAIVTCDSSGSFKIHRKGSSSPYLPIIAIWLNGYFG